MVTRNLAESGLNGRHFLARDPRQQHSHSNQIGTESLFGFETGASARGKSDPAVLG